MLPLSPPPGYFKEIDSIISKFTWNDKCPRIKLTTLQHPNSAGGLAVPNFELYYWSFQLVLSKDPVLRYHVGTKKMKTSRYQVSLSPGGTEYPGQPGSCCLI